MRFQFIRIFLIALFLTSGSVCFGENNKEWTEYRCSHFLIYYKKAPKSFVKTVEKAAEEYYTEITRSMGFTRYKHWTWDNRAKIYIYDSQEDYVETGKLAKWSHGYASPKDKVIRTFPSAHGFFDSTLPHELGHIIFREFIGFRARIPGWFEEGIAMRQEKAQRWGAHQKVKGFIEEGTFMSLTEMSQRRLTKTTDEAIIIRFYTEAASVINYLFDKFGNTRFTQFCRKLKNGNSFEESLKSAYLRFKNIEELNKDWMKYLKNE